MTDEDQPISTAVKAIGTGPAAQEAYRDLLKPAFQELAPGLHTVAKTVTLALAPLRGLVWSFENLSQWLTNRLAEKLAEVPPERITTPNIAVAGPILLYLPFVQDEDSLREMYATLLATSMRSDRNGMAHPAFVRVIQELSPEEARILRHISEVYGNEFHLQERQSESESRESIEEMFRRLCMASGITDQMQSDVYLDNLLRLRVIGHENQEEGEYIAGGYHRHGDYAPRVRTTYTRVIWLTDFGRNFLRACVAPQTVE